MDTQSQSGHAANYGRPLIRTSRIGADRSSDDRPLIQQSRIADVAPGHMALEVTAALSCTADWPAPEVQQQLSEGRGLQPRFRSDSRSDSSEVRYG